MTLVRLDWPAPGAPNAGVAELWLCRAERRNAMTPAMLDELQAALGVLEASPPRALLVAGEGEAFCAGFDLSLCRESDEVLRQLLTGLSHIVRRLRRLACPVAMAVQGAAVAGGCAMLAGADVVITHAGARLGYPVVRLGISPAVTGPGLRLAAGDGPARARMLDPELIDGREAARVGLAHECLPEAGDVLGRARQVAVELASKGATAVAATRALLAQIEGTDHDIDFDAALAASLGIVGGAEQRSRLASVTGEPGGRPGGTTR